MESSDPGYRVNCCRETALVLFSVAGPGGPLLPGFLPPCSKAGNTPTIIETPRRQVWDNPHMPLLKVLITS